ncbi:MAG: hypothetical protein BWK76_22965 [Desulfobulbaceae bacterium A2]|nr:MAG: hypothetical protein BWK76_22965 [Desulfobulbaceae bacterium A2]
MGSPGEMIEYIENGRFLCGHVLTENNQRLHLINQHGREVNLPPARVLHRGQHSPGTDSSREEQLRDLTRADEIRRRLAEEIRLDELWEIIAAEGPEEFTPEFLAELYFGAAADSHSVAAMLRAVFQDRLFFRFKNDKIQVHAIEQVEQLRRQQQREQERALLLERAGAAITRIMAGGAVPSDEWPERENCLNAIREFYLFGSEGQDCELARLLLKETGLNRPHDPYYLLVRAGVWQPHENLSLLRTRTPTEFTPELLNEATQINGQPLAAQELMAERQDLRHLPVLTIDGASTRDFDDALHLEERDGNYLVGIHIADVAHFVPPDSPLFREALTRGTSLYFPERQVPMLPELLSQGCCSLHQGETRPTLSFLVTLSPSAEVLDYRIVSSLIAVQRRLTYEEADRLIAEDATLQTLDNLRRRLRQRRLERGALLLPFPDVVIELEDNGGISVRLSPVDTPARTLVSEFMILANTLAAQFLAERQVPGLFRAQGPPKKRVVQGEDASLFRNAIQRRYLSRGELRVTAGPHSGLGVQHYTTITSPIRRFLDLIMQHQLHAVLQGGSPRFSREECLDFIAMLEPNLVRAGAVRQQRQRYWLLRSLEMRTGARVEALVTNSGPQRLQLLLTDCLLDAEISPHPGRRHEPGETVLVRIARASALDTTLKLEW